ncbi:hypothetical protein MKJ04_02760 [Pontibacter sp. E15-1]|uniref:hypothetical protein n=1 Tax=Pontibacter sp. E15-1 TaxID=2919918 RepID=UPI001F4F83DB|nr:hypothetical protein [Pontibacter sp. E15-1]MCJ8163745.1 hypothetical protein [Pontibacter sp. E15-1]
MRSLLHPFFLSCLLLFCLNQGLEQAQVYIWPLHTHLDDLLCLPITLQLVLVVQRAYFRNPAMVLPRWQVVFAWAAFSVCFELLLPLYKPLYTADALDVAAYAFGGLGFAAILNKPLRPRPQALR